MNVLIITKKLKMDAIGSNKKRMRIMNIALYIADIIYTFGGTESYTSNLIEALQKINTSFNITLITEYYFKTKKLSTEELVDKLNRTYGVSITTKNLNIKYISTYKKKNRIEYGLFQLKLNRITRKFYIFFYCSKGLLTAKAKYNIAIIHFPMDKKETFPFYRNHSFAIPLAKYFDKKYLKSYLYFLPNSQFTAYWLKTKWNIPDDKIKILYPPVTGIPITRQKIKNQILICSRLEKSKKIHELINAFMNSDYLAKNCKLVIAGATSKKDYQYIHHLKNISPNINFIFNPSRSELEILFAESFIFWHAKGYNETDPYQMEHFGITTVEAMSAGCIPVVINKGGQTEIVTDECGFKWDSLKELTNYTEKIYHGEYDVLKMQQHCIQQSKKFFKDNFLLNLKQFLINQDLI